MKTINRGRYYAALAEGMKEPEFLHSIEVDTLVQQASSEAL
jgi:hypothetical protein